VRSPKNRSGWKPFATAQLAESLGALRSRPNEACSMTTLHRSRRSCLCVPGSSEKMLAKAPRLGADEIVLDLEDAVIAASKDDARASVVRALASDSWRGARTSVRVNAPRTPWCHQDVIALAGAPRPPGSVVIPKVECAADVTFVERLLDGAERQSRSEGTPMRLQALIETAAGLSRVQEIAASSRRLDSLILGYADLAASLGRRGAAVDDLDAWRPAQEAVLLAARAGGCQAIDGPHLGVTVDDHFLAAATRARDAGYDGKWAIHPSQVGVLNELFAASPEELARAAAVLAALDNAEQSSRGAVALDGAMLDEAARIAALRTLACAPSRDRR
jgi:citrate lyase subunit beta/citryl-CoA lyase